jgi:hypothetical protein
MLRGPVWYAPIDIAPGSGGLGGLFRYRPRERL